MKTLLLFIYVIIFLPLASIGQRYWRGTTSSDWNNPQNWSASSGGAGGASVPGQFDNVFFDGVSTNPCILNTATTISIFNMSGGTLSLTAPGSLTANSTFTLSGGVFNAGNGILAVPSNTFTVSGGILNAESGTFNIGNNLFISSTSSIVPGTSHVIFNGSFQQDVLALSPGVPGTIVFYNLTINKPNNSVINFSSTATDTFQINNNVIFTAGRLQGSGFIKVEKDLWAQSGFGGTGVPIACTGPNPSIVRLDNELAVTGPSPFVGIAKSSTAVTVSVVQSDPADTIRIGNFNAQFFVRRGTFQFPDNPPVKSSFGKVIIEAGGVFISTSNYLFNAGEHIDSGGVFLHNNGTYVFNHAAIPGRTFIRNHVEKFYNLIIDIGSQFSASANDTLQVDNDLILRSGQITGQSNSAFNVKRNFTLESGMSDFNQSNTSLVFSGTTDQNLLLAPGKESAWNAPIAVNKPSGELVLQSPVQLNEFGGHKFNFISGIVRATSTNYLFFGNQFAPNGASNASYVDGPVRFQWYDPFVFPIGNGGYYAPVQITGANVTDTFTAQYFHEPSPNAAGPKEATLQNINRTEWWQLTRINAPSGPPPYVWLSYDNIRSGGVTDPTKLRVSKWNGTIWQDGGNDQVQPPFIRSTISYTEFSPFTLASVDAVANPLPLHFTNFTASRISSGSLMQWTTENEVNNNYFDIQRSSDGVQYDNIGRVAARQGGQGSYSYEFTDNNMLNGRNYYRLQQVDLDGRKTYSKVVNLQKSAVLSSTITIYPNPATQFTTIQCTSMANKKVSLEIIDSKGSLVSKQAVTLNASGEWTLNQMPLKGMYIIRVIYENTVQQGALIVR
jgi:hypothetical protein